MSVAQATVLTYHSIAEGRGPTSIPPQVFARQMESLAELGYRSLRLEEFLAWLDGDKTPLERCVLITFDDAFHDFRENAFPILQAHGFSGLVFVPTGKLGARDDWPGGEGRPLMSWSEIAELASEGVEFGAHGVRHLNLDRLDPDALVAEIELSGRELEDRLSRPILSFAPPYGRAGRDARDAIAQRYKVSFGTRLGRVRREDDRFDVPRIEMHYFRDNARWVGLLEGRAGYLRTRRALRAVRERLGHGWGSQARA